MNDQEYLTIMSELKFIGSVGENQYINLSTFTIENRNVYNIIMRKLWYKNESGLSTAKYCRDVITRALNLLKRYEKDSIYTKTIQSYITDALVGMNNLKTVHEGNHMAYAMFDSISVAISQKIEV